MHFEAWKLSLQQCCSTLSLLAYFGPKLIVSHFKGAASAPLSTDKVWWQIQPVPKDALNLIEKQKITFPQSSFDAGVLTKVPKLMYSFEGM